MTLTFTPPRAVEPHTVASALSARARAVGPGPLASYLAAQAFRWRGMANRIDRDDWPMSRAETEQLVKASWV